MSKDKLGILKGKSENIIYVCVIIPRNKHYLIFIYNEVHIYFLDRNIGGKKGSYLIMRAQCGLVGANDCKYSQANRLTCLLLNQKD
jgi:hypothetical protein